MIDIYLYYYDNYEYIISSLRKIRFKSKYTNNEYDKYEFNDHLNEPIVIIIYKNLNILAIQCNKDIITNEIRGLSLMEKVNLLDKNLFTKLFEHDFSRNLCNVSININILGSEEELVEYEGHRLLDMNLLEQFDFYDYNSNTKLKAYSLQPKGYKYILKVNSINKLEFNNKYDFDQIQGILFKLIIIINLSDRRKAY